MQNLWKETQFRAREKGSAKHKKLNDLINKDVVAGLHSRKNIYKLIIKQFKKL